MDMDSASIVIESIVATKETSSKFTPHSIQGSHLVQESPKSAHEESYVYMPPDVGLTECLKLRNFFGPDK